MLNETKERYKRAIWNRYYRKALRRRKTLLQAIAIADRKTACFAV